MSADSLIEVVRPFPVGLIRHAVFDFDGTINLIREGWQAIMAELMLEQLLPLAPADGQADLRDEVRTYVLGSTGMQSIDQMRHLCGWIERSGGRPGTPQHHRDEYARRLSARTATRIADLRAGAPPATYMVPGSVAMLEALRDRGVRLYLASGTEIDDVRREAGLLQVDRYFDGGIWGALADPTKFSKKMVIDAIVAEHGLHGPELLGVGDGPIELEDVKSANGIAVGLATFEPDPRTIDPWKRTRLLQAGADLIAANFLERDRLINLLFGGD